MPYDYQTERPTLFTEGGVDLLLRVRDHARRFLQTAGAFTAGKVVDTCCGETFTVLAALDYLVERGDVRCVTPQEHTVGQDWVFVGPKED